MPRLGEAPTEVPVASRLDAAVAERVMGWRLFWSMGEWWGTSRPAPEGGREDRQGVGDRLLFQGRRYGFFPEGWSPSSSGEAMLEVIARMRELGFEVNVASGVGGGFIASFSKDVESGPVESDASLPVAVARAAVAALEGGSA